MNRSSRNIILIPALLLYASLWYLLHPFLGFLLDSDGVAYLTIARRVNENFSQSINGLWSPLNSWLIAPFLSRGYNGWEVAKLMNAVLGGLVIAQCHELFRRFNPGKWACAFFTLSISIAMAHHVYFQMFGDVLQLVFVLTYLRIVWFSGFQFPWWKPVLCGIIMGIGFYAKSYSFHFFVVHFGVSLWWLYRSQILPLKQFIRTYILGVLAAVCMVIPWSYALYARYQVFSLTGMAGRLNLSWNINRGKTFKPEIKLLIPPGYPDSPSFWEDPYPSQGPLSSPFTSVSHFAKWIVRVAHTTLTAIVCFNELSGFSLAILLFGIFFYFFRKEKGDKPAYTVQMQLLLLSIVILPLGYLMMHIETRYIWLNGILLSIAGYLIIEQWQQDLPKHLYKLLPGLLAVSFIVHPLLEIENLKYKNKDLFETASLLNSKGYKGSFTSNETDAGRMWVIAYLTGNPFYTIERSDYSEQELMAELKRYQVNYYLLQSSNNKSKLTLDSNYYQFLMKGNGFDWFAVRQ